MTNYLNAAQRNAGFTLLPLLLLILAALYLTSAQGATAPDYSAAASGTTDNLNLSITIDVADADLGMTGNYYVAFNYGDDWYFNTPQGWVLQEADMAPVYASGPLSSGTSELLSAEYMSSFIGAQLYLGYGFNESDMVDNGKYAMVYTVTEEAVILGPDPVLLGTAGGFAILAKTAVSTVPASVITGDVGVSPAATSFLTGFSRQ